VASTESSTSTSSVMSPLDCFREHGGVLLLVMSLTASRTIPKIQKEFDDPVGTHFTAQFGHCAQELMNLLLTGNAVSNVFDNSLSLSGEMVCRGIQHRPAVGYLTQLEAMRYCEVGSYYKSPIFPIWVVGSTSHFTVMFGDSAALKESQSDRLLDECRRAFKSVEGGEENGFIPTNKLGTVLQMLQIQLGGADSEQEARAQTLGASLEVNGASIILWDDFWKAASRLKTGATLETVLQGDGGGSANPIVLGAVDDDSDNDLPPLLTEYAHNETMAAAKPATRLETDEEMARRLGAEWGSYSGLDDSSGMNALSTVATAACPMEVDSPASYNAGAMTDEEIARKLQEQFNRESSGGISSASSVAGVSGSPIPFDSDSILAGLTDVKEEDEEDMKPAAKLSPILSSSNMSFEQFGDSFLLQHYNGLRGGVLTQFRITRLTADEAVGASIALTRTGGSSTHSGNSSSGSQDLEDVLRTKWPSCTVNWLGKQPPYID
jgi:ubiquitin carboxyl-terminal hydrolase MINDY-3/4